jgi:hypothetical protein
MSLGSGIIENFSEFDDVRSVAADNTDPQIRPGGGCNGEGQSGDERKRVHKLFVKPTLNESKTDFKGPFTLNNNFPTARLICTV